MWYSVLEPGPIQKREEYLADVIFNDMLFVFELFLQFLFPILYEWRIHHLQIFLAAFDLI